MRLRLVPCARFHLLSTVTGAGIVAEKSERLLNNYFAHDSLNMNSLACKYFCDLSN